MRTREEAEQLLSEYPPVKKEHKRRRLIHILMHAPHGTLFEPKALFKLNDFELHTVEKIIDDHYVPKQEAIENYKNHFSCPNCKLRFDITARI